MKKGLATILSIFLTTTGFAADSAHLQIKISNAVKQNKYFVCLYGVGCLSVLHAGKQGKHFPMMPMDMSNIQKLVITDVTDMSMSTQPMHKSCQVTVAKNQVVTVTGKLVVKNNKPYIDTLRCTVKG